MGLGTWECYGGSFLKGDEEHFIPSTSTTARSFANAFRKELEG